MCSLSLVIGNQNNTSPTTKNSFFSFLIDTSGLDPYLLSSELLTLLKSSENLPIWRLLIFTSTSHTIPLHTFGPVSVFNFHLPGTSGSHCAFFLSPFGLYLSDCTNMMIMSHCGISVVIGVRLYDRQDELITVVRKKTCPEFYIIYHTRPVTANCIARHAGPKCWLSWKVYERWQYRRI